MFAVISNNFGKWQMEESGVEFDAAVTVCSNVIGESHGGDARVVKTEEAGRVVGQFTDTAVVEWFTVDGERRNG